MKLIDDIMDAMGIVDEVEEEEKPRKPRENKAAKEPVRKEAPVAEDDYDEEEEEMSTKDKITALFKRKKSEPVEEAAEEIKVEEKTETPARRRLNFAFNKKNEAAAEEAAPVEKKAPVVAKPAPVPRRPAIPMALGEVNMQMLEPTSFDDSQKVADCLRSNQPVIVNFEKTDPIIAKRMTDFISGTIYALQGNMKKIGRNILICAPKNVDIDNGLGLDNRGDDSWK